MTLRANTFEGGTNGTTYSAGASGGTSGNQFDTGSVGADATRTWSTAQAVHGSVSLLISIGTGGANNAAVGYGGYAATQIAERFYFRLTALPSVNSLLTAAFLSDGGAIRVEIEPAGTLRIGDRAGTRIATSSTLSVNTWYRLERVIVRGATATNGTINYALYAGDSTTALSSFSTAAADTGTTQTISNIQWGRPGTTGATTAYSLYLDDVAANDGTAAFLGPAAAANVAPTANAGPDLTVEPWSTVTLTGAETDTDGTITSRAWTQTVGTAVTLSAPSAATTTFTAPASVAGETLRFSYTATDSAGASSSDSVNVTVLPAAERILIGGTWVPCRFRLV